MQLKRLSKVIGFMSFLLVVSCNLGIDRIEYAPLPSARWEQNHPVVFSLVAPDTIKTYQWYIVLRNNEEYPFSNLHLISSLEQPNGTVLVDTLTYQMAFPNGEWMGKNSGSLVENKLWYLEDYKFPLSGTYTLSLRQAMRRAGNVSPLEALEGITDIGYSIEEIKE